MTAAVGAAPVPDPAVVALLQDAASWRLLGRLFECPSEAWRQDVATLASEEHGKTVPDAQGRGFVVVKVDKVVPGNALLQPSMITRMQAEAMRRAMEQK